MGLDRTGVSCLQLPSGIVICIHGFFGSSLEILHQFIWREKNLNQFYFLNRERESEVKERLYHHWGVVWAEIQSLLSAWLLSRATLHPTFFMKKLVPRDCGCSSPFLFFRKKSQVGEIRKRNFAKKSFLLSLDRRNGRVHTGLVVVGQIKVGPIRLV